MSRLLLAIRVTQLTDGKLITRKIYGDHSINITDISKYFSFAFFVRFLNCILKKFAISARVINEGIPAVSYLNDIIIMKRTTVLNKTAICTS